MLKQLAALGARHMSGTPKQYMLIAYADSYFDLLHRRMLPSCCRWPGSIIVLILGESGKGVWQLSQPICSRYIVCEAIESTALA